MKPTDLPVSASTPLRVSRRLRYLLIGSLALNLLVLGSAAGLGLRHMGDAPRPPAAERSSGFGPWHEGLTREDHRALRRALESEGYDLRSELRADRADRALLLEGLRADPFDPDALRSVIARLETRAAARMALGNRLSLDHVAEMTPEARRAMAERIEAAEAARRKARQERRAAGPRDPQRDPGRD